MMYNDFPQKENEDIKYKRWQGCQQRTDDEHD